jgi:hypothetical protein
MTDWVSECKPEPPPSMEISKPGTESLGSQPLGPVDWGFRPHQSASSLGLLVPSAQVRPNAN